VCLIQFYVWFICWCFTFQMINQPWLSPQMKDFKEFAVAVDFKVICSRTMVILCPKVIPLICCLLSSHLFFYKDWSVNIWIRGSLDNCSGPKATENITLSRFLFHSCLLYLWTFRLTLESLDVKSVTRFHYMSCLLERKALRNLFWPNFQHLSWKRHGFIFVKILIEGREER